jgi:NTP pyrophosphatase (non-canonical NTP hydrolase)
VKREPGLITPVKVNMLLANDQIRDNINTLVDIAGSNAFVKGFHQPLKDMGDRMAFAVQASLLHTEISEAVEAMRLPDIDYDNIVEELADVVIRVCDMSWYHGLDLGEAIRSKVIKNMDRQTKHGKEF